MVQAPRLTTARFGWKCHAIGVAIFALLVSDGQRHQFWGRFSFCNLRSGVVRETPAGLHAS
jgi:hypothetical protein